MIHKFILILIFIMILWLGLKLAREYFNAAILTKAVLLILLLIFTFSIIIYPEEAVNAARNGLSTWFNVVCPSLLPFFIGSELLIDLGVVKFIGILLEPIMRPLFNVPGCGSFPFIMSISSGYPIGSKIVGNLYKDNMCSKLEAQRMLTFCSTSGPLFMIGAVGIGILNSKTAGTIIALSQYLGAISVGIIFSLYKKGEKGPITRSNKGFKKAYKSIIDSFQKEKRPIGLMISEAVMNSVNSLLLIGGLMTIFSVIISLIMPSDFFHVLYKFLNMLLSPIGVDEALIRPLISGLFEVTIGSKMISASSALFYQKIVATSAIIGWSGISIHFQVAAMIKDTDLNLGIYIFAKFIHSIFCGVYSYFIIKIIGITDSYIGFQVFNNNQILSLNFPPIIDKFILSTFSFIILLILLFLMLFIWVSIKKILSLIIH